MARRPTARTKGQKRTPSPVARTTGTARVPIPSWVRQSSAVWIWVAAGIYVLVFAVISFGFWRVGGYGVETDALGGYLPETQKLLRGQFTTLDGFKGPGYHLAVAAVALAARDLFVAAKIVALVSAGGALILLFRLVSRRLGSAVGWAAVLVVATNPQFALYTIQIGTDMYFLALTVAAATLVLGRRTPYRAVVAGALAGLAYLTRYNGLSLIVSGLVIMLLADRRTRLKASSPAGSEGEPDVRAIHDLKARLIRTGTFLLGAFTVVLPWSLFTWSQGKGFFYNTNYLNIAYELYGRGVVSWDQFWEYFNPAFRSFREVVAADPSGFVVMILRNGVEHLWMDWRSVLVAGDARWVAPAAVLWGVMTGLGLVVAIWRYRWRAWPAVFFGLMSYGVLVPVFYGERFSLPMVPVYGVLAAVAVVGSATAEGKPLLLRLGPLVALVLLVWGGTVTTVQSVEGLLRYSPEEVRLIADEARPSVRAGERILARKPHIAYFLDLEFVRMPILKRLDELPRIARDNRARYLFVSGIEAALRPPLVPLLDPGNAPAFLRPIVATSGVRAVLYEFTIDIPPMSPSPPAPRSAAWTPVEANVPQKVRLGRAYLAAGRPDLAYERFREALEDDPNDPTAHRAIGEMLLSSGRHGEAVAHLERALALDPASVNTCAALARAYDARGESPKARELWQQVMRETTPGSALHEEANEALRAAPGAQP